uniref:BRCT domain-containing protein n=1 Tax=Arundo donax TaxID=35708 RepID=A0A0A9HHX2_ARUDO
MDVRGGGGGSHAHAGRPFTGMRFLFLSSPGKEELEALIGEMGGQVLPLLEYKACTHICVERAIEFEDALVFHREGKKVVNHDWLKECFDRNMLLDDELPRVVSTTRKRSRSIVGASSSSLDRSVRRDHTFVDDEEIYHRNHELFLCKHDRSPNYSLRNYATRMKNRLEVTVATPGSLTGHFSVSTESEVKLVVVRTFVLMRCLHKAGLTLAGQFSSKNVVISETLFTKNIRFGHLPNRALKKSNPDDEELDRVRFIQMIRRELFVESIAPHDLNVWLALVGEKGFEELLLDHISLMQAYPSVSTFLTLYGSFLEMEHKDIEKYESIVNDLSQYSDWKQLVSSSEGNSYLQQTLSLRHIDPATNKMKYYEDDIRGLLRLLDCCLDSVSWGIFVHIVRENFPNLLSDFQEKMYKAGYYTPTPRLDR